MINGANIKPGFHSNARKALRKEKYASKIKSAQETQQMQENYASKKQKYASASHATDESGHCARKCNDRIDSIFLVLRAMRAFEWKPGFIHKNIQRYLPFSLERTII